MQDVLVFAIVAVAAVYVIRRYVKSAKSGKCCGGGSDDCGCGGSGGESTGGGCCGAHKNEIEDLRK